MSTKDNDLKQLARSPLAYIVGGIGSALGVIFAFGIDPFTVGGALLATLLTQSTNIFTALSIAGFTIAPNVDWLPAKPIQWTAIAFGVVVILLTLDTVWEAWMGRRG